MNHPPKPCYLCNQTLYSPIKGKLYYRCHSCDSNFGIDDLSLLYVDFHLDKHYLHLYLKNNTLSLYNDNITGVISSMPFSLPINKTNLYSAAQRLIKLIIFS